MNEVELTLTVDTSRFESALLRAGRLMYRAQQSVIREYVELGERAVNDMRVEYVAPHAAIRQRCFEAATTKAVRDMGLTVDDLDAVRNALADPKELS